eukprot:TRINITY_DN2705_c0_g1_i2.p1 TRINITY_DN2705_c0_g1~~TRINITY_DN2705_c0_g1_i2.p1  ORF type:complete len:178 (+),score=15.69 TRINITY_DN2705_c0_g1_i2:76-609(+)
MSNSTLQSKHIYSFDHGAGHQIIVFSMQNIYHHAVRDLPVGGIVVLGALVNSESVCYLSGGNFVSSSLEFFAKGVEHRSNFVGAFAYVPFWRRLIDFKSLEACSVVLMGNCLDIVALIFQTSFFFSISFPPSPSNSAPVSMSTSCVQPFKQLIFSLLLPSKTSTSSRFYMTSSFIPL